MVLYSGSLSLVVYTSKMTYYLPYLEITLGNFRATIERTGASCKDGPVGRVWSQYRPKVCV